jgi:hypothetical protein
MYHSAKRCVLGSLLWRCDARSLSTLALLLGAITPHSSATSQALILSARPVPLNARRPSLDTRRARAVRRPIRDAVYEHSAEGLCAAADRIEVNSGEERDGSRSRRRPASAQWWSTASGEHIQDDRHRQRHARLDAERDEDALIPRSAAQRESHRRERNGARRSKSSPLYDGNDLHEHPLLDGRGCRAGGEPGAERRPANANCDGARRTWAGGDGGSVHRGAWALALDVLTATGNQVTGISVRIEEADLADAARWECSMDLILRAAMWQDARLVDRSQLLHAPAATCRTAPSRPRPSC